MKSFFILFFIVCSLVIISCGGKENTEEGIVDIVEKTDSILATLAGQKYEWASVKAYSTVMAYYPEPDIIFLNENLTYRQPGNSFNRYYFRNGSLIHFIGKKLSYLFDKESKMKKELTTLTLYLDPDGDVISYSNILNNNLVGLDDSELEQILSHSKELYTLVGNK